MFAGVRQWDSEEPFFFGEYFGGSGTRDFMTNQRQVKQLDLHLKIQNINKMENDYELKFCETCFQMKNHLDGICQKCKTPKGVEELSSEINKEIIGKLMENTTLRRVTISDEEMKPYEEDYLKFVEDAPKKFIATAPRMNWFILQYFGEEKMLELHKLADEGKGQRLIDELYNIWYRLPDNKFNIIENPDGWSELLNIVEF